MCIPKCCFTCIIKKKKDENEICNKNERLNINSSYERLKQYSKFKKIGYGATSKIYLSTKKSKLYICKSIHYNSFKKGFREIKILKKLDNNYFPKLHEFIDFDKNLFIFMNYENSIDIHKYCFEPNNKISIKEIIYIIREMGNAIQALHLYKFVHLDIKLENFIINENKNIKLIDFGTVKPIPLGEKKLLTLVGTKNYNAPEIYRNKYHLKSDVWAYVNCIWILLVKDYCFNHQDIKRYYTPELFPYHLFKFPSLKHINILKKFHKDIKILFKQVFKIFPIDRPSIEFVKNFDYEKYLIRNK